MRFAAVLNRDGGTLRTLDLGAFSERIRARLESAGHAVEIEIVQSKDVEATLRRLADVQGVDVIMVGGGDGTVSAAAHILANRQDKALAVLPAGTMNLFARGLGIPQVLDRAVEAFATGNIHAVDLASANGRIFAHQFSIGMHAKMVHLRDRMEFKSRVGKILASIKAAYRTVLRPPSIKVHLKIDDLEVVQKTSGVGISNNLFGEGTLPYAEKPNGGVLGVYVAKAYHRRDMFHFVFNLLRGRWKANTQVEIYQGERVILNIRSRRKHIKFVMDGELSTLSRETTIRILPKALNVLVPAGAPWSLAA